MACLCCGRGQVVSQVLRGACALFVYIQARQLSQSHDTPSTNSRLPKLLDHEQPELAQNPYKRQVVLRRKAFIKIRGTEMVNLFASTMDWGLPL